jgi:hypothetical protein
MINLPAITSFLLGIGFTFNKTIKQIDSCFSDEIRFWQFQNQVKILEKAKIFCQRKNKPINIIPKKFLVPLLEEGKNEDNESIQNMWAALLGNAVIGEAVHPAYVKTLSELTLVEAKILTFFYQQYKENSQKCLERQVYINLVEQEL